MKHYILCPVRHVEDEVKLEIEAYIESLKSQGEEVHSFQDVNQDDPTGFGIIMGHLEGMQNCDVVDVFWNADSTGSHCDFGMALALEKPLNLIKCYKDNEGKSYWKAMSEYAKQQELVDA